MSKNVFHKTMSLFMALISVVTLVGFASGCDNNTDIDDTTTTQTTEATTEATTIATEPTKAPVQDEMTEAGKAFFNELLVEHNNSFIELIRMLVDPQNVNATWLITPQYEDFSAAQYDAVIYPELSQAKYSDVVNEEEFAELKGDGKAANYWFFINGADIDGLFNQVFEKNRFTTKDLMGGNDVEKITSKGYYMFQREKEYNRYYTYYVNYRYVEHVDNKVILKVNLISAVEISATPGYVGVCEFNTQKNLGRLALNHDIGEMPEDFTYEKVKEQLDFNEDSLKEFTFTLIETAEGLRLYSVEI